MCGSDCAAPASGRSRLEGREVVLEVVCDDCGAVKQDVGRASLSELPIYTHPPQEEAA